MKKSPFQSLVDDREMMQEIQDRLRSAKGLPHPEFVAPELPVHYRGAMETKALVSFLNDPIGPVAGIHEGVEGDISEAIILAFGRPSLLIQDGRFGLPESDVWSQRLNPHLPRIGAAIPSVGRVELLRHPDFEWVGTAWVIAEDVLVTNRHVAMVFAERQGNRFAFKRGVGGDVVAVRVDFREEYSRPEELEIEVTDVVFIAEPGSLHPDMALLKVAAGSNLPEPLPLSREEPREGMLVGVVGYPARDSRNSGPEMARIFENIFDVKRFAPGFLTAAAASELQHDCTTLGGNSGSPVVNLETGEAVGLHFAGRFRVANYAAPAGVVQRVLAGRTSVGGGFELEGDETPPLEYYAGNQGFREDFLGADPDLHVPCPALSAELRRDAVVVDRDAHGIGKYLLNYTHFSVVMSRSQKLALYTAVNIDGNQEVLLRRRNTRWKIDPRIDRRFQFGNELYVRNNLDRGHLVRRLDPVWGSDDVARKADDDTFHYTNSAPQHERLNQRNWLKLEEYLLNAAHTRDFKASIFTGPVFGETDIVYRDARIPGEFWKVAVMVGPSGKLHATAYLLSQTQLLDDLEFAFGRFRTYQVRLEAIEEKTGLDFGVLRRFDPLAETEGFAVQVINGPEDVII